MKLHTGGRFIPEKVVDKKKIKKVESTTKSGGKGTIQKAIHGKPMQNSTKIVPI